MIDPTKPNGVLSTVSLTADTLANAMGISSSQQIINCNNSERLIWGRGFATTTGSSPERTGFIQTGIPNLYLYIVSSRGVTKIILTPQATSGVDYARRVDNFNSGTFRWIDMGNKYDIYLYKAGPISKGGVVAGGFFSQVRTSDGIALMNFSLESFTVNVSGCNVTTPTVPVSFGDVHRSHFRSVGSTTQPTAFSILANCDSEAQPAITFTGTSTSSGNILPIDSGDSAATGVGIQLSYKNSVIELGKAVALGETMSGINAFNFSASYIQTGQTITGGTANATANFTISYL